MASQKLSRFASIRARPMLELTLRTGKVVRTPYFRACYLAGEGPPGVAFLAGKKVGGAVKRNRAKRVLREAFRTCETDLSGIETLVFVATDLAVTARYSDIREAVHAELRAISGRDS